ncbi:MAG: PLP-dependent cysteine synthase family protein [Thermoanaerobaculia bacterium]
MSASSVGEAPLTARDLFGAIGRTPLLELKNIARGVPGARLLAKAEHLNPGGSVKDRPARAMLEDGLARGLLAPGKTILEATSGNTGIADAMLGRALGFPVTLCVPARASAQRKAVLKAYGAELVLTDPLEGADGAIRAARELTARDPDKYFYPDQYSNPANWRAHFESTGPEIWEQTEGRLTHFVAGLGTSGTFGGVTRYLKARSRAVVCVSMQPDGPLHGLEGMKHMGSQIAPPIYDPTLADAERTVATEEAYAMCRRLARQEGIFVGPSSGANVVAALSVARAAPAPATAVTILCDGGGCYVSESFWEEP